MDLKILIVCVRVCVCVCVHLVLLLYSRPDGSPGPGGTALVNNSDEAHYQGSADLSLYDSTLIAGRMCLSDTLKVTPPPVCSCK